MGAEMNFERGEIRKNTDISSIFSILISGMTLIKYFFYFLPNYLLWYLGTLVKGVHLERG